MTFFELCLFRSLLICLSDMGRRIIYMTILAGMVLGLGYYFDRQSLANAPEHKATVEPARELEPPAAPVIPTLPVTVAAGDVWSKVGERAGLSARECYEIYEEIKAVYDLARLTVGNECVFFPSASGTIERFVYNVDDERELTVERSATGTAPWTARVAPIVYEVREKTVEGTIDTSLYESALAAGADERAVLQFAESLEYNIDFASDPRIGDKYKFIYQERYLEGVYIRPGNVLAGVYKNGDKSIESFYFVENEGNKGFFDPDGNSIQKMFLRAPLAFKYISSPFTTGLRYIEAFNVSTGHRAIDYAATAGTPIRAVGDGTVTFAGWNGGYGRMTSIRHNETYSTNYGHQSKIIVKKGQRVKQGEVIGYVGSTGFSTGPHLHYEMVRNGVKINPASVVLPPGKPIGADRMADFKALVEVMRERVKIE